MGSVTIKSGDIFTSNCEVLVCPVNCEGVMGAGLAKEFKKRFPDVVTTYMQWCEVYVFKPGALLTLKSVAGKYVMFFPTKIKWSEPSQYSWIEEGLDTFMNMFKLGVPPTAKSFAFPMLGCGLGGLDRDSIALIFQRYIKSDLLPSDVVVEIYDR